jgi:hypothetical protein
MKLDEAADHRQIYSCNEARDLLEDEATRPQAVLLADPEVMQNLEFGQTLVEYTQNGGTTIMYGPFPAMMESGKFDRWMRETWGILWSYAGGGTCDVYINPYADGLKKMYGNEGGDHLDNGISVHDKFTLLQGVAEKDKIYQIKDVLSAKGKTFPLDEINDESQTAVAFRKIGHGWLGWMGSVNPKHWALIDVTLGMCGLAQEAESAVCESIMRYHQSFYRKLTGIESNINFNLDRDAHLSNDFSIPPNASELITPDRKTQLHFTLQPSRPRPDIPRNINPSIRICHITKHLYQPHKPLFSFTLQLRLQSVQGQL